MAKRFRITIGILLAAFAGLFVWRGARLSEPEYQGRTLSLWLDGHVASTAADPPYNSPGWKKADEALRHIGTNAVPTLLQMIRAKDPAPVMLKLLELARRQHLISINYRYAYRRNEEAEYAFRILGTNAVCAVPALIKIYEEGPTPSSQMCAALALSSIGPAAKVAIPALLRNFSHANADVRFRAVTAIYHIGRDPDVVLPALRGVLKDEKPETRWNAVIAIGNFGARGRSAVPDLIEALNDQAIKEQVEIALWRIAPEKLGKRLVVEDPTAMVAKDVTTEALKVTFYGERKTIIPEGTRVPFVAQYWSSDPRPQLTLYRGASSRTVEDHFLGQFEVMGLPSLPTDINVSVLFVIANGQIVLCARDNSRNQLLEIRRVENEVVK